MALNAVQAEKLKPEIEKNYGYFRIPSSFCCNRKLTPAYTVQFGAIYSYSNPRKGKADCTRTYRGLSDELHFSTATVTRGFERGREQLKSDNGELLLVTIKQSSYRIDKELVKSPCIRFEKFFLNHIFKFKDGTCRRLTPREALFASYFYDKYDKLRDKKSGVIASYADLAEVFGCCDKTVAKTILSLMKCNLLFRPEKNKGLNGRWKSVYIIEKDLLRLIKETRARVVKARRKTPEQSEEASAKVKIEERRAREQYYDDLRFKAEKLAEHNKAVMLQDTEYCKAKEEQPKVILGLGKYKALSPAKRDIELRKLNATIAQAFQRYGLSESDLSPRWKCSKCNDTGRKGNGQLCGCFPQANFTDLQD